MQITLISQDNNGEIIEESTLNLEEGDRIIATFYPINNCNPPTIETVGKMHDMLKRSLEDKANLITIPWWIKLSILKVGE